MRSRSQMSPWVGTASRWRSGDKAKSPYIDGMPTSPCRLPERSYHSKCLSVLPALRYARPPNGALVLVTVNGIIEDADSSVANATYAVTDEYGQLQPAGALQLDASGGFSVGLLEASRRDD